MATMRERSTKPMYDIWAWFYNWTFGALVRSRQRRAVQQLPFKPGDRILDLGVGTGLTLKHYPKDVTVIGMDLSHGMISKARVMCQERGYDHIKLVRGDGMNPPFAAQSFDHIIMCHTVTVVSDPARLLNQAARIVKPGGRIVLANHFRSTNSIMGWLEKFSNPFWVKIGWRSDVALEDVLKGVDLQFEYHFKHRFMDLWQIVCLTNNSNTLATSSENQQDNQNANPLPAKQPVLA
ncbi:MAG: class I SAM-dependent methyltransferase [Phycisphaeraceae bacterium]|nr:class I SAM-dependent methyltransferase [Phycisphaeraceae bacterium]